MRGVKKLRVLGMAWRMLDFLEAEPATVPNGLGHGRIGKCGHGARVVLDIGCWSQRSKVLPGLRPTANDQDDTNSASTLQKFFQVSGF